MYSWNVSEMNAVRYLMISAEIIDEPPRYTLTETKNPIYNVRCGKRVRNDGPQKVTHERG